MFIVPLSGTVSWKNPPVVTIMLIVVNTLVYLLFQTGDDESYMKAMEYYFTSGLARIEVSAYVTHEGLDRKNPKLLGPDGRVRLSNERLEEYAMDMSMDEEFTYELDRGRIITSASKDYQEWTALRAEYKKKLSKAAFYRFGFRPADWSVGTAFTHMFLHGGWGHLIGNMVFLWLVGCVLEMGCGRAVYLAFYFIGGVCAVAFFGLLNLHSLRPLVGASGAIAGLIGSYMVLYGMRRIKVFYSLGFYFNYTTLPALVILPVWIGNEVLQNFLDSYSGVAYMAHVGGLIGGAGLGLLNRLIIRRVDTKVFDGDPKEKIPGLLEEAMRAMERLDTLTARKKLQEVLSLEPNHRQAVMQLYNVEKLKPKEQAYDEAAKRLMEHLSKDRSQSLELLRVFREYMSLSAKPEASPELLHKIGAALVTAGHAEDAEKIIVALLRQHPESRQLPRLILALARAYEGGKEHDKARRALRIILEKYPSSHEAETARGLMKDNLS